MLIIRASLRNISPQIVAIFPIVVEEFVRVGCETVVLTSGYREPEAGPLHHGYAADFDSQQMPNDWNDHKWLAVRVAVKERVGDEYDIVAHGPRAHLHAEFDPKTGPRLTIPA